MELTAPLTRVSLQVAEPLLAKMLGDKNRYHRIPIANAQALQRLVSGKKIEVFSVNYLKGQEVVHEGQIVGEALTKDPSLNYAHVPLGCIVRGSVVVLKGGKGTKTLGPGDFVGLFETSDWLLTERSRHIGDWTLIADTDCEILFFGSDLLTEKDALGSDFRNHLIELARADHVPQPISTLPLLDWTASHTTRSRLSDCAIVVHTHLLPNSVPFFRHLSHLVLPGRIYILEKPYSTVRSVFENLIRSGYDVTQVHMEHGAPYAYSVQRSAELLWRKVVESQKQMGFRKILVVDDGGDLWLSIPWKDLEGVDIAGVEQTQRGITRIQGSSVRVPPIVSVASCGIKKLVESEFIAASVVKKLLEYGAISDSKQIGILGVGSIGSAIQRALATIGRTALSYDPAYHAESLAPEHAISSIDVLLNKCDLIIGTVGSDSITGTALERVSGRKVFASASSADVEFASLLKLAEPSTDSFGTRTVHVHEDLHLEILNGGYPVNFDRIKDSTPDEDIVLTRCLLYIGAMQAAYLLSIKEQRPGIYDLDKVSQTHLLKKWLEYKTGLNQRPPIGESDVDRIVAHDALKGTKQTPTVWEK